MKNPSPKTLKAKLWKLCQKLTREKYGNVCYICGARNLIGANWHTCHLIPSGSCGAYLRYDLRNLRPCCYHDNINLGGNGAEFYRQMVKEVGQKVVDKLFKDKNVIVKADKIWFLSKIAEYQRLLESF